MALGVWQGRAATDHWGDGGRPSVTHPYETLPAASFWRRAVAGVPAGTVDPVVTGKFRIAASDRIATAGSCFAQHISRHLGAAGFRQFVTETAHPITALHAADFGYGLFTARYGNLYTARQLLQMLERAYGCFSPMDDIWHGADRRVIDPFRPQIQPGGFASRSEYWADRGQHFAAVREAVETLDVLVFTLGLTEAWMARTDGAVYPICPGVAGGEFDPVVHAFVNFGVMEVIADLSASIAFIRARNAKARFIITVSPVPLIATMEQRSVLASTTYSKSVLRVAAEEVASRHDYVAYFPSYEVITGSHARGAYFAEDLRSVTEDGVEHVMRLFMQHYMSAPTAAAQVTTASASDSDSDVGRPIEAMRRTVRVMCDEELLDQG